MPYFTDLFETRSYNISLFKSEAGRADFRPMLAGVLRAPWQEGLPASISKKAAFDSAGVLKSSESEKPALALWGGTFIIGQKTVVPVYRGTCRNHKRGLALRHYYSIYWDFFMRKCGPDDEPIAMLKRDQPRVTIKHELFIQLKNRRFQEDYAVVKKLGEGSFGLVYEVVHKTLGLRRALKIVRNTSNDVYSTREEIEVLTKMDHPNILKLYEYYEVKDCFYLITELFTGKELVEELAAENVFTELKAAEISFEILKALHYTHSKRIAHRDIKAENLLALRQDGKWIIKVIDWGLGTLVGNNQLGRKCGTPEYAAPEIFLGSYDQQCDMWSFGVILHVMLLGELPFRGANFGQTMHKVMNEQIDYNSKPWETVSPDAKELIAKLLVKDPKKRLTAEQTMKHPWVANHVKRKILVPNFLLQTLQRLKQFRIQNNLNLAAINYINNCLSTQEERRRLAEIFRFLDTNDDGVLSFDELVEGYASIYSRPVAESMVEDIFNKIDMNRTGMLQYNEFITYAMLTKKTIQEHKLKLAFQMFDTNKDNRISVTETRDILFHGMEDIDQDIVQKVIDQIDQNGDGFVDQNEFVKCLSNFSKAYDGQPEILSFSIETVKKASTLQTQTQPGEISKNITATTGDSLANSQNSAQNPSNSFTQMMNEDSADRIVAQESLMQEQSTMVQESTQTEEKKAPVKINPRHTRFKSKNKEIISQEEINRRQIRNHNIKARKT